MPQHGQCQNNLKQFGMALHNSYDTYGSFPPAAIPNDSLSCEQRLSWIVDIVPFMEQMRFAIDRTKGSSAAENRVPMTRHYYGPGEKDWTLGPIGEIKFLGCPSEPALAAPDSPGLTDYVGISGLGSGAASLPLGYPGVGFFGCDRRPKREDIKDGMSTTIAVIETNRANGSWTVSGSPTVRGLDPSGGPYLGIGGQFGSGHSSSDLFSRTPPIVTNVVFADGSVRGLTNAVSPEVFQSLATIAGGEPTEPVGD